MADLYSGIDRNYSKCSFLEITYNYVISCICLWHLRYAVLVLKALIWPDLRKAATALRRLPGRRIPTSGRKFASGGGTSGGET